MVNGNVYAVPLDYTVPYPSTTPCRTPRVHRAVPEGYAVPATSLRYAPTVIALRMEGQMGESATEPTGVSAFFVEKFGLLAENE